MSAPSSPTPGVVVHQIGRSGAGAQLAAAAANELAAAGLKVSLIVHENWNGKLPVCANVQTTYVPTIRNVKGFKLPRLLTLIRCAARARRVSREVGIWYFPMQNFWNPVVHRALHSGTLKITSVHETGTKEGDHNGLARFLYLDEERQSDIIVAHSESVLKQLRARPDRKYLVAPLSPYQLGPHPSPPTKAQAHGGPLRLLMFGRMQRYKGVDLLLDALADVNREFPNSLHLTLLGHTTDVADVIEEKATPLVDWRPGYVDDADLARQIRAADLVVAPYRAATQSAVVTCAYAELRPVLVTNVGGLPEQVWDGETGLICEPTVESLAAALRRLVAEPSKITAMSANIEANLDSLGWGWLLDIVEAHSADRHQT